MSFWFILSVIGLLAVVPVHFVSVSHIALEERFGKQKGARIGAILGMISGWGIFLFLFGVWLSPQDKFLVPLFENAIFVIPLFGLLSFQLSFIHLIIGLAFVIPGAFLGVKGVMDIGLEAAETHHSERIITTGLYAQMRHPQYVGMVFSHIGVTFLVSGLYSLLITPLVLIITWTICWKEEQELVKDFGEEYVTYQKSIPMFIPRIIKTNKQQ